MHTVEEVKYFLEFLKECRSTYEESFEAVGIEDKRSQDLLHAIEFSHSEEELTQLGIKLKESRIVRRCNKDRVEMLEPIINFMDDQRNKKTLDLLPQLLGTLRKIEEKHNNRSYHPRVETISFENVRNITGYPHDRRDNE
jgi:hypothetical protein